MAMIFSVSKNLKKIFSHVVFCWNSAATCSLPRHSTVWSQILSFSDNLAFLALLCLHFITTCDCYKCYECQVSLLFMTHVISYSLCKNMSESLLYKVYTFLSSLELGGSTYWSRWDNKDLNLYFIYWYQWSTTKVNLNKFIEEYRDIPGGMKTQALPPSCQSCTVYTTLHSDSIVQIDSLILRGCRAYWLLTGFYRIRGPFNTAETLKAVEEAFGGWQTSRICSIQ